ncbi:class E sortase [Amycolatopsis antarctica]|uniref:Class E sortase n=1 Tax=Amycolatopsis antarctica TaxID=1854586 RepID=A0A263D2D1_9PSEU|nr:class E sortase [Amycolatopsis antarctica]OZM72613.1 class E sortase [Amycolatopsis antarctica]
MAKHVDSSQYGRARADRDAPTEVFAAVGSPAEARGPRGETSPPPDPPSRPPRRPSDQPPEQPRGGGAGRGAVRTVGELLITAGLVVLLFVVYELYVTNLFSADKQNQASAALDEEWKKERRLQTDLLDGQAFARLYIPSFGTDYKFTIQEGVDAKTLEVGPGHYKGTARPGEPGNVGVAGHRVGKGAPFNDLDLLNSCDAIIVETAEDFFVYRVLPMQDEAAGWAEGKGTDPRCTGVTTLQDATQDGGGAYGATAGRKIVLPSRGDAVAPVPYRPEDQSTPSARASLLTLTTCHPQFSDRERLIVHSVLTKQYRKDPANPGQAPPELEGEAR